MYTKIKRGREIDDRFDVYYREIKGNDTDDDGHKILLAENVPSSIANAIVRSHIRSKYERARLARARGVVI
jgi:hypothetical protein